MVSFDRDRVEAAVGAGRPAPFVRRREDTEAIWAIGALILLPATADTTGSVALAEYVAPPKNESPLHVHTNEDELFYVLSGSIDAYCDGEWSEVRAGGTLFLPRGLEHGFRVTDDEGCRMLVTIQPPGFEAFFREIGEPAPRLEPPPDGEVDVGALTAAAEEFGVEIRGPLPERDD